MLKLTDAQVRIAAEVLIEDAKLRVVDLHNALQKAAARARRVLAEAHVFSQPPAPAPRRKVARTRPAAKPPVAISPAQLRSRKLQGRYLNLIRQIPEADRAQYQQMIADDPKGGRKRAIEAMGKAVRATGGGNGNGRAARRKR